MAQLTGRDITAGLSGSIGSLRELRVDFFLTPSTIVCEKIDSEAPPHGKKLVIG